MPEKAVLPQTHMIRYAPHALGTWSVLPEMVAFKAIFEVWDLRL